MPQGFQWTEAALKMFAEPPKAPTQESIVSNREENQFTFENWDWQGQLGPQGEELPVLAIGWKPDGSPDFGTGLKGWANKALSNVEQSWWRGWEEGLKISGVTEFAVTKVQGEEKGAETLAGIAEERKPETELEARFAASTEATKEIFEQLMWGALDLLAYPAEVTEQALGAAVMSIGDYAKGKDPNWQQNFQASRLAYSAIFDATIREQMNRRIEEGVRPDLAKMEIMQEKGWTLWPELIGQVFVDPLNLVTIWGKGKHAIRLTKEAKAGFHIVENSEIAKAIRGLANVADDAGAARYLDDIMRGQKGLDLVGGHLSQVARKADEIGDLSEAYRLSALTSDGKVSHLSNQVGEILLHVANNSSADESLEILNAMVKSVSDDSFEAAEGIATMMRFADPEALFSEAGNATTAMLSRMTTKFGETWLDDIAKAVGDGGKPALVNMLMDRVNIVGNELYPPVVDMLKAEKKAKALVEAGKEIPEDIARMSEMAGALPGHVRATAQWHGRLQKFPVGPLNRFFVGAYLGWNPGYAFRNYANNVLTMFVDYGPGVLWGKADDLFNDARKLHGESELLFGAHGFGSESLIGAARRIEKEETTAKATVKAFGEGIKDLSGPSRKAAEMFEVNAAKRIVAKTYKRTFQNGMQAMVKEVTPQLRQAGFTDDFIKHLPTLIETHYGDVDAILDTVRAEHASGVVRAFTDVDRIDGAYRTFLEDVGKWDDYVHQVLQAPTREAAESAATKIFDDLAELGGAAYRDGIPATGEHGQFLQMMSREGGLSDIRGYLINIKSNESDKAIEASRMILDEADRAAERFIAETGQQLGLPDMKAARGIQGPNWGAEAKQEAVRLRELAWKATREAKKGDLGQLWAKYTDFFEPLGEAPPVLDYQHFADALWHRYDELTSAVWGAARDDSVLAVKGYIDDLATAGVPVSDEWGVAIDEALEAAQKYDNIQVGRFGELQAAAEPAGLYGTRTSQIAQVAQKYGIRTAEIKAGRSVPTDKHTLSIINKYAKVNYSSLEDVPLEIAERAFAERTGVKLEVVARETLDNEYALLNKRLWDPNTPKEELEAIRSRMAAIDNELRPVAEASRLLPPHVDGEAPTMARAVAEQMADVENMHAWVVDDIAKNFDKTRVADRVTEQMLSGLKREIKQKVAETRLISSRIAQASRDFSLLNYSEKKYYDLALAYLYPFGFWHKGTYSNWLKRVVSNPSILGDYARYKDILATVHADMPEWWRYNLNTNDLPGIQTDNPLFFNLEATLWPLNGITNVDFDDPYKRINWWTYTLDFMNRFGPSTWTPINMVTGLVLYQQGEKEAGERWIGRLIPQTATIKALGSKFGASNLELDPFVSFLMDGLDPYERRRVGRALGAMEQESVQGLSPYSRAQIYDAAYNRQGEIWDEAVRRAVNQRANSNLTSFFAGVGFKARSQSDLEIDQFYNDYYRMWEMEPNMRPDEFREAMDALRDKYPFMETVLISRRSGIDRDRGLAYNVLARIPPGRSDDYAELVGIDGDLLSRFYEDKGRIDQWLESDRQRFMAGVIEIAATLDIPKDMTRHEWTAARIAYNDVQKDAERIFGEDIWDKVDAYFVAKRENPDLGNTYIDTHPEVSSVLDWRSQRIIQSPLLNAYYGGAGTIENYIRSQMYDDIEKQMGKEIFDVVTQYGELKTYGEPGEAKKFYAQHKRDIKKYYAIKDDWQKKMNQVLAKISNYLPEIQDAAIRPDAPFGGERLAQSEQPQMSFEQWSAYINPYLMQLIQDYYFAGEDLPYAADQQLDRIARDLGYENGNDVLQAVGSSMYQKNGILP